MQDQPSTVDAAAPSPPPPGPTRRARLGEVLRGTYRVIRSNPTGRITLKVLVALIGGLVVAIGIALIPLPGPGWALVILGLSIWAIEFAWARHLLSFTRAHLSRWLRWIGARPLSVRLLIGAVGLVFVGFVVVLSLRYSFGINLWADVWGYITTH
jgi:uncharacterized protein (TIGR02611 family)